MSRQNRQAESRTPPARRRPVRFLGRVRNGSKIRRKSAGRDPHPPCRPRSARPVARWHPAPHAAGTTPPIGHCLAGVDQEIEQHLCWICGRVDTRHTQSRPDFTSQPARGAVPRSFSPAGPLPSTSRAQVGTAHEDSDCRRAVRGPKHASRDGGGSLRSLRNLVERPAPRYAEGSGLRQVRAWHS